MRGSSCSTCKIFLKSSRDSGQVPPDDSVANVSGPDRVVLLIAPFFLLNSNLILAHKINECCISALL